MTNSAAHQLFMSDVCIFFNRMEFLHRRTGLGATGKLQKKLPRAGGFLTWKEHKSSPALSCHQ